MKKDLRTVLLLVWSVVTLTTAAAAVLPFVLSERTVAHLVPPCESKRRYGRECILCGATTAFLAISHGDWAAASRSNRAAIPLFAAFVINAAAWTAYLGVRFDLRQLRQ